MTWERGIWNLNLYNYLWVIHRRTLLWQSTHTNTPSCFSMSQDLKVVATAKFEVLGLESEKDHHRIVEKVKKATTMSTKEEISARIAELGEIIKTAKAEKKPKEEWDPSLQEMLALKVRILTYFIFRLELSDEHVCLETIQGSHRRRLWSSQEGEEKDD